MESNKIIVDDPDTIRNLEKILEQNHIDSMIKVNEEIQAMINKQSQEENRDAKKLE